jgi:VIT1/CCC1 family predicted Fe2+/Mn2+ transporter
MAKAGITPRIKRNLEDYLREFVYGGIDGAVTTFAVVAGATGARFDTKVIVVLGFANLFADGFSMSVGSYLSTKSEHEVMHKRGIVHPNETSPILNGVATYIAFILVGIIPLLVYSADLMFDFQVTRPFLTTSVMTILAFVGIGFLKSKVAGTPIVRAVLETLILGTIAAGFAYILGDVLERAIAG